MHPSRYDPLFNLGGRLHSAFGHLEVKLKGAVEALSADAILSGSVEQIIERVVADLTIQPIELHEADANIDSEPIVVNTRDLPNGGFMYGDHQPTVSATRFCLHVPFSGDGDLFHLRPSSFQSTFPYGAVQDRELVLCARVLNDQDRGNLKQNLDKQLAEVRMYLGWQRPEIEGLNNQLSTKARTLVEARRAQFDADRKAIQDLGYPARPQVGAPLTVPAPSLQRRVSPVVPAATARPKPEPVMRMEHYEHVLEVVERTAIAFEKSPQTYAEMDEENLRQLLVAQLNGHYDGRATAETFNESGKTDILVNEAGKTIFVAECKFWKGVEAFQAGVDQLLGRYVSWRDTKLAVILFNRGTQLTTVLKQIPEALSAQPTFKRTLAIPGETRFRSLMRFKDDPERELYLTVLVFNLQEKKHAAKPVKPRNRKTPKGGKRSK